MGENCQKQVRRVTKTGNSSTPKTQVKPCNGCGLGVFQGRLFIIEIMSYFIFGWKAGFGILSQANGSAWQGLLAALPFTIYVLAHAASCCPNG
ncbi:hypothetical protein [Xanthomonas axonopodis]